MFALLLLGHLNAKLSLLVITATLGLEHNTQMQRSLSRCFAEWQ